MQMKSNNFRIMKEDDLILCRELKIIASQVNKNVLEFKLRYLASMVSKEQPYNV